MIFHPSRYLDVPNVDVVSWTFNGPVYDQDKYIYIDALDHTRRLTARQAQSNVRKLVCGLKHQGVRHRDIILIHSFSDIIYPILYLGIVGSGASFIGTNPSNTPDELLHIFTLASPRYILTSSRQLPAVLLAISTLLVPIPTSNIFILNTPYDSSVPVGFQSWEILLRYGESSWERFNDEKISNETIASLFLTSGTMGLSKVAAVSHRGSIARCIASSDPDPKPYSVSRLLCLPLFHGVAATASHIEPLRYGIPTYIMTRFSLSPFLCNIHEHRITETSVVPAIVSMILQGTEGQDEDTKVKLNSLRLVRCAGAPLDMGVQTKFQKLLNSDVRLVRAWGLTEFGTVTSFLHREVDDTGSCGRLLANVEAMIVDANGNEITEDGVQGEILVRGPSVMSQYIGNDEATKEVFMNGWLRTGDIGYCQSRKWYIVGRSKDMIKVRGWQVAPTELEACLLKHDLVEDVAVIGVNSTTQESELPRAYVVLKQVSTVTAAPTTIEEELKAFLGSRLARYKALDGGVRIVESLPKTASGKTAKRILREDALRESADRQTDGFLDS